MNDQSARHDMSHDFILQRGDKTVLELDEQPKLLEPEVYQHQPKLLDYNRKKSRPDLDALIDILVVTIGAIHSLGANGEAAWNEVMRTNFAKIDPETGKVRKREDGKVLKPEGWTPPNLEPFTRMPNL